MGGRIAGDRLGQQLHALLDLLELVCLHLRALERHALLLDYRLAGGQLLFGAASAFSLQINTGRHAPPGNARAGSHQQSEPRQLEPGRIGSRVHASRSESCAGLSTGRGSVGTDTPDGQR